MGEVKQTYRIDPRLILTALVASLMLLSNLGGQDYSLDEPETIVLARSISLYGLPSAWDGKNLISINNGADSIQWGSRYIWSWHPWLQHYIAYAASIGGGINPAILRLPFAFFGIGSVLLFYELALVLFGSSFLALLLSLQLTLLMPFFLYMRQVRYYSPTLFFGLLVFLVLIYHFKQRLQKKHYYWWVIAQLGLFFSHYLAWTTSALLSGLLLIVKRETFLGRCLMVMGVVAAFWFTLFKPFQGNIMVNNQGLNHFVVNTLRFISYSNAYLFPLILLPFIFFMSKQPVATATLTLILGWIMVKTGIYSWFVIAHGRYLIDVYPFFILLYGFVYQSLRRLGWNSAIWILFILSVSTNLLHTLPQLILTSKRPAWRFWPAVYQTELGSTYFSIQRALGQYLQSNGRPGDLFWSNGYPIYLYLYSGVPAISPVCDSTTHRLQGPSSITEQEHIRWFIFFTDDSRLPMQLTQVPCFGTLWQQRLESAYERIPITLPYSSYHVNDPDIVNRNFPPQPFDSKNMVIYQKKE